MGIQNITTKIYRSDQTHTTIKVDPSLNEEASYILKSKKRSWQKELERSKKILSMSGWTKFFYVVWQVLYFISTAVFGGYIGQIVSYCTQDCRLLPKEIEIGALISFFVVVFSLLFKDKISPKYEVAEICIDRVLDEITEATEEKRG